MTQLATAAASAPDVPGVYYLLDDRVALLYVGKAVSLRRRLHQHARAAPSGGRLAALYERVAEVRWEVLASEEAAAAREADLIVGLRPPFNADSLHAGRWNYVALEQVGDTGLRFTLTLEPPPAAGPAYGCFPHLGRGVALRPAVACSDGYTALLRLLWAASAAPGARVPGRVTRSAPDSFTVAVAASTRSHLHAFLSGRNSQLLDVLADAHARRDAYLQPGLRRDHAAAGAMFACGPRALRELRLRYGRPAGPMSRATIEDLLGLDAHRAVGEFTRPRLPEPTDAFLGRNARPWARSR
jgi:predicted GIY-YIG superfamily endonuclease